MRLLYAGHDHERASAAERSSKSRRDRNPSRSRWQHLPLHRIPQHRAGRAIPRDDGSAAMNKPTFPYIGQPLKRREDFRLLTGKGRYVDDIRIPGTLHMAVLRSPHAHAVIKSVDLAAAKVAPGVRVALSGKALEGKIGPIVPNWVIPGTKVPFRPVVAIDRVRFVGECVALVVAETLAQAYDAVALIDVDYEVLPAVTDEA